MNRREFIGGAVACAVIWSFVESCSAAELTFGVLSDVHLDERHFNEPGGGQSVRVFEMALEHLRERRVDGVE